MIDYKDKYPIGSKWETRGGGMVTVVQHHSDGTIFGHIRLIRVRFIDGYKFVC